jgi:hypothetical protein
VKVEERGWSKLRCLLSCQTSQNWPCATPQPLVVINVVGSCISFSEKIESDIGLWKLHQQYCKVERGDVTRRILSGCIGGLFPDSSDRSLCS